MRSPPRRRAALAGAALLVAAGSPASADPRLDYMLHCRGCHLEDGSGAPGIVPDFRDSVARFLAVPGGRAYLIRVPGSAQSALPDDRLAEVLNFIVRRYGPREIAEAAPPFTPAEVAAARHPPLSEVAPIREALLRAMGEPAGARASRRAPEASGRPDGAAAPAGPPEGRRAGPAGGAPADGPVRPLRSRVSRPGSAP